MSAPEIKRVLTVMASEMEDRGDLGPYRAWEDHRRGLSDEAHDWIARIVKDANRAEDPADYLRRQALAF